MMRMLSKPKNMLALARYGGFAVVVGGGLMSATSYLEQRRFEGLAENAADTGGISPQTAANEDLLSPLLDLRQLVAGGKSRKAYARLVAAVNGMAAFWEFMLRASVDPDAAVPADCQAAACGHHQNIVRALDGLLRAGIVPCGQYQKEWVEAYDRPVDLWRVTGGMGLPLHARWRGYVEALLATSVGIVDSVRSLWHDNLMAKLDNPKGLLSAEELFDRACGRLGYNPDTRM